MLDRYVAQVRLLLSTLPVIAGETAFALKGGTAINLFYRDMPRLSVDIDLTWLPVGDRRSSLRDIDEALDRIAGMIASRNRRVAARRIAGGGWRRHAHPGERRPGAHQDRDLPDDAGSGVSGEDDGRFADGDGAFRVRRDERAGL